eukprot:CAMPEP_0204832812 /NCGR_PEP_ID=MMETSP1346-20131115/14843_1 /ASSEMBLY_ACC=CAM_ASM_000771 /TAXON_ID=215587 /ORGANISM="Aplanochytrium stocchinoi, Strain GSBS06" /LENGTH=388 /DNA_ID=CAMNT_0051964881 /DNA_START=82 /DNA_END=1248 /DNA_ORIENTATION=-
MSFSYILESKDAPDGFSELKDDFEFRKDGDNKGRAKVLVLYTGGTLGMVPDETTGALTPSPEFLTNNIARIIRDQKDDDDDFPDFLLYQFEQLIDSSDMGPSDWALIANLIGKHYYKFDGFVVVMGTDTMAYAASALSFMLVNLSKPVIFTGSMIPMYKGYSDADRNLILSISIAGTSNIPEVCIFFHAKLLRGNRSKKVRSEALDAFDSPNFPPLAVAGTKISINEKLILNTPRRPFKVLTNLDSNVLVVRLVPGFRNDTLRMVVEQSAKLRALVLDLYGVGNAPGRKSGLMAVLQLAIEKNIVIAVTSQCLQGSVNLKEYAVGRRLYDIGAVSTNDMTVESVATKLAFLLGQGLTHKQVNERLSKSIRGEVSDTVTRERPGTLSTL